MLLRHGGLKSSAGHTPIGDVGMHVQSNKMLANQGLCAISAQMSQTMQNVKRTTHLKKRGTNGQESPKDKSQVSSGTS